MYRYQPRDCPLKLLYVLTRLPHLQRVQTEGGMGVPWGRLQS